MSIQKEIKKQINSQTRDKVGNIKIESTGTQFIGDATPPWLLDRPERFPMVTWNKTSYAQNRGASVTLTPLIFNSPLSMPSYQLITAPTGDFVDKSNSTYYNARFSGWAGIKGGGTSRLGFRTKNSNVSVWVDGERKFASLMEDYNEVYVTLNISTKSLVEIFWYSPTADNYLNVVGDIAKNLSYWETSDNSPYIRPVEWYTEDPITSDSALMGGSPTEYIKLKWWFGEDESETSEEIPGGVEDLPSDPDGMYGSSLDVGGFGVWSIEFQDAGEIDVISDTDIVFYGNHPNLRYARIKGRALSESDVIIEVDYTESYDPTTNMTTIISEDHGLTDDDDGRIIEVGILKKIQDIPMSDFSSSMSDIYETQDADVLRGERYYYLVDTFDTSPNKNRGGMTSTYQTIIAGDFTAPSIVQNLTATRNAPESVTLEWDDANPLEIKQWNVYSDTYSADYTITGGTTEYCFVSDNLDIFHQTLASNPGGFLVSIEVASGTKYIRYIVVVDAGRLMFNELLPETVANNDTLRFLHMVGGSNTSSITIPTPPPADYELVDPPIDQITL